MSQIRWDTTDGWEVLTGWDPPMQCFFLDIGRSCDGCYGEGQVIPDYDAPCDVCNGTGEMKLFGNLESPKYASTMGCMTAAQVVRELTIHLVEWPPDVAALLLEHQAKNLGNEIVKLPDYGTARDLKEEP